MLDVAEFLSRYRDRTHQYWEERLAFVLCGAALVWHLIDLLSHQPAATSFLATAIYVLPVAAALCAVAAVRSSRNAHGILLVSAAFLAGSIVGDLAASPRLLHLLVTVAALFLMLIYLRIGVAWYVAIAVACGLVVWWSTDLIIALGCTASIGGILFVANYLVQLVLDHRHERQRFLLDRDRYDWKKISRLMRALWIPAIVLLAAGVGINWLFQMKITEGIYEAGVIKKAPESYISGRSGMERDVYYTIDLYEEEQKAAFLNNVRETFRKGDDKLVPLPKLVEDEIEKLRPRKVDEGKACQGAEFTFRILRKNIGVSFRTVCRGIVQSIEGMIISTFERAKESAVSTTKTQVAGLRQTAQATEPVARDMGLKYIGETYESYRSLAGATFLLLFVLSIVSYLLLASAVIGSFYLVLGRLLFDPNAAPKNSQHTARMTFRLDPAGTDATPLDHQGFDELKLWDAAVKTWFVSFYATRIGAGTHMRLCSPQWAAVFFQRLFTGRLLMTRVDLPATADYQPSGNAPVISAPGDLKIVLVRLKPGQEVVFHMREMLAFSDKIRLKSVYTAHVATHMLGLGSFYSIASGEGYLVLLSEGARVKHVDSGLSLTPDSLLAWDRRTEFCLAQETTLSGIWFNDPSVISKSAHGTGVIDEGRARSPGLLRRLWRLARYLFMPF